MLKNLVRNLSRERVRPPSPEFASSDARAHDREVRAMRSDSGDRATLVRDNLYTHLINSPPDDVVYLDTGLEALSLESIISPSLQRMRPTLKLEEGLLPPLPGRGRSIARPEQAHTRPSEPVAKDVVFLRRPTPNIVVTPAPDKTSPDKQADPFDLEFRDTLAPLVTPMPKRPVLQRKAASYRTQRELPLRVQAVRRSHQEQFAQKLLASSEVRRQEFIDQGASHRRASEADLARPPAPSQRPKLDPLQRSGRSQSSAPNTRGADVQVRSRSSSREPSYRRHERLPSGPSRGRSKNTPRSPAPETDFYLQAAMEAWTFDS